MVPSFTFDLSCPGRQNHSPIYNFTIHTSGSNHKPLKSVAHESSQTMAVQWGIRVECRYVGYGTMRTVATVAVPQQLAEQVVRQIDFVEGGGETLSFII